MGVVCTHPAETTGHDRYPPTTSKGGSSFVSAGGHPLILVGQEFLPHTDPQTGETHTPVLVQGSSFVTVDGIAVGMIGDALDCGDRLKTSATSFVTIEG